MRVCIDSASLGTQNSLVIGIDGTCQWQSCPQDCEAHLGSGPGISIQSLALMQGMPLDTLRLSDTAHLRSFEVLGVTDTSIPWSMVLGRHKFTSRLRDIVRGIQEVTRDTEIIRYVSTYRRGNKILEGLQQPRIDIETVRRHRTEMTGGVGPLTALASFSPNEAGLAPPVEYDRTTTSTGRLKVSHGPSILTLQKECRDIITSRVGGSIWEVDFVSLEPRVALNIMGIEAPRDIYNGVKERLKMSGLERSAVKQAVISALYGSSSTSLAEALGGRREAMGLIREVKEYFQVAELTAKLRSEMACHGGRLHNYYGRPLIDVKDSDPDSKLISHYLQSSAVDVALTGFDDMVNGLKSSGIVPIYVIHDAILLDVPQGCEERLQQACTAGVDLEMGHFELGLKRVS